MQHSFDFQGPKDQPRKKKKEDKEEDKKETSQKPVENEPITNAPGKDRYDYDPIISNPEDPKAL